MKIRVPLTRIGSAVGAMIVCLALMTACGSDDDTTAADGGLPDGADETIRELFPQDILDKGVLTLGLIAPNPPNTMVDAAGKVNEGLDLELLSGIARLAGLKVDAQALQFSAVIPSLQAGRSDVTGSLVPSEERLQAADFVIWNKNPWGLLVPKGNPKGIQDSGDLCGLTVAAAQGSFTKSLVDARQQDTCDAAGTKIEFREYATQDAAILAVKSGQADVFPQGHSVTAYIAKITDDGGAFDSIADLMGVGETVYFANAFGVDKNNQELVKAIQAGLQELIDNGEYLKILEKYGLRIEAIKHATINEHDPSDLQ